MRRTLRIVRNLSRIIRITNYALQVTVVGVLDKLLLAPVIFRTTYSKNARCNTTSPSYSFIFLEISIEMVRKLKYSKLAEDSGKLST